jgi:Golgi nucleoside diphosphatase
LYGFFADVELIHAIHLGYTIVQVYQTVIYNTTANNCPEFKGREFIRQCMYYKTLYSKVSDYNEDVLRELKAALDIDYNIIDANNIQLRLNAAAPWENVGLNSAMK